ncbi:MAG: hypothetical protein ACI9BD_000162 [Candidatus Marinamargulisbacteria bacterium]|jgi:hypothetical protein
MSRVAPLPTTPPPLPRRKTPGSNGLKQAQQEIHQPNSSRREWVAPNRNEFAASFRNTPKSTEGGGIAKGSQSVTDNPSYKTPVKMHMLAGAYTPDSSDQIALKIGQAFTIMDAIHKRNGDPSPDRATPRSPAEAQSPVPQFVVPVPREQPVLPIRFGFNTVSSRIFDDPRSLVSITDRQELVQRSVPTVKCCCIKGTKVVRVSQNYRTMDTYLDNTTSVSLRQAFRRADVPGYVASTGDFITHRSPSFSFKGGDLLAVGKAVVGRDGVTQKKANETWSENLRGAKFFSETSAGDSVKIILLS